MAEASPKQMRISTAAEKYDMKEITLMRMCRTRKVKAAKVGKLWFVTEKAMDDLFQRGQNTR